MSKAVGRGDENPRWTVIMKEQSSKKPKRKKKKKKKEVRQVSRGVKRKRKMQ